MAGYNPSCSAFGLGFYVAKSPSVADPAGLFRWQIAVHVGFRTFYWRIR